MKRKGAGIIFTDGKQVLLLKRSNSSKHAGTWDIPGGGTKNNETALENAIRETKEECKLTHITGVKYGSIENDSWTTFIFNVKKTFDVHLNHEHSAWDWVDLEKVQNVNLHPKLKVNLPKILKIINKKFPFKEWLR